MQCFEYFGEGKFPKCSPPGCAPAPLNILFTFKIFDQLALDLKNRISPEIFYCIEIFFTI